ncbi:hypothetical protein K9N68_11570 [Kovacikia minuta CCNUW1]|uniref:NAD-dependent epimerase/dehydratase family protein n=1 Tax=Kovacikia minuta TaxID=2931930 RepID=UPI001CCDF1A8|nr:hypothetical protein [Kovacikia minuta]UBF28448.1 hypothetical protein K9N68_11570 [Kovacikia minuta CCNUW1]
MFIDDFIDGLMLILNQGEHLGIYHIGTMEEVAIAQVAHEIAHYFGRQIQIVPGALAKGGTPRRCPDITKLAALGYQPRYTFQDALPIVAKWYDENSQKAPREE